MMTLAVSDLMRKKVDTIKESDSIQETAKKMKDKKVSSLLVVDRDGKPIGLVTERDLVRKVCIRLWSVAPEAYRKMKGITKHAGCDKSGDGFISLTDRKGTLARPPNNVLHLDKVGTILAS